MTYGDGGGHVINHNAEHVTDHKIGDSGFTN